MLTVVVICLFGLGMHSKAATNDHDIRTNTIIVLLKWSRILLHGKKNSLELDDFLKTK